MHDARTTGFGKNTDDGNWFRVVLRLTEARTYVFLLSMFASHVKSISLRSAHMRADVSVDVCR